MTNNPSFIRRICLAKRAEFAGDRAIAILRLDEAAQLTSCPDDQIQLAAWRKRLEVQTAKRKRAQS